jgi:SAM-dependent methyltransferase
MDKYLQANCDLWNDLTPIHAASQFYDLEGFKKGKCVLMDIDREEVGDVAGKNLLHLQCHFGLDTMSWARLGAKVTGVDFSDKAIALAGSLAAELNIPAQFFCCNLYDLLTVLSGKFDIVLVSGGVLSWLPDLRRWAEIIANFLEPGGFFYIREYHPVAYIFDDAEGLKAPVVRYPYFHSPVPMRFEDQGSYADRTAKIRSVSHEWAHSLADIVNSLLAAGLRIEYLHEFPYSTYRSLPFLKKGKDGLWRFLDSPDSLPLMFSIKALRT